MKKHKIGIVLPTADKERKTFLDFVLARMDKQSMPIDYKAIIDFPRKGREKDIALRYKIGIEECFNAECDFILFIEDDDYYPLDYVETMYREWVNAGMPKLLGLRQTIYYHLKSASYRMLKTTKHSSAFCTCVAKGIEYKIGDNKNPFYDIKLWKENVGKLVRIKNEPIGIKHGVGICGGSGHKGRGFITNDNDFEYLSKAVDAKALKFYKKLSKQLIAGKPISNKKIKAPNKANTKPLVTVLINSYKEPEGIFKKALDSVILSQNVKLQIIVSTVAGDPCIEWVKQYKEAEVVISPTPGIFEQLNNAVCMIRGEYVCYASSNDVMYKDKLCKEVEMLQTNPDKAICYSGFDVKEISGIIKRYDVPDYSYSKHLKGSYVTDCAMFKATIFKKYMPFQLRWKNNAYWDLFLRIYNGEGNVFVALKERTWLYIRDRNSNAEKRKRNSEQDKANRDLQKRLMRYHTKTVQQTQCHVSCAISFFEYNFKNKYDLCNYIYRDKPVIFFGLYNKKDYQLLKRHKTQATIVWAGSDSMFIHKYITEYGAVLKKHKHIAISTFILNDLERFGINAELKPISPTSCSGYTPEPLGDKVYMYIGNGSKLYGAHLLNEIQSRTTIPIIAVKSKEYQAIELKEIYKQCFMGLRLTSHDGFPNTVAELGLMGRPCVFNDKNVPNTMQWDTVDDIIKLIRKTYENRHQININQINEHMQKYMEQGGKL